MFAYQGCFGIGMLYLARLLAFCKWMIVNESMSLKVVAGDMLAYQGYPGRGCSTAPGFDHGWQ